MAEVAVTPGDKVQAGQLLVRLEGDRLEQVVVQAEVSLTIAQAQLAQGQAGVRPEELAAAEAAVEAAEARLAQVEATLAEQQDTTAAKEAVAQVEIQVAQAEVSLAVAQLNLEELLAWIPDESAVELAQANLTAAYANYNRVAALAEHTDDQLTQASVNLENAKNQLAYARADYDTAWSSGRDWEQWQFEPTGGGMNPTGPSLAKQLESERESTQRGVVAAQLDLEAAQAAYNLAVLDTGDSDLKDAWSRVVSAQAILENAQTGPSESEIEVARLQVQQAELSLTQAERQVEAARAQADAAQAQLDQARAQRDLLLAGARAEELAILEAQVKQAEATLAQARLTLGENQLVAPFAGTVVAVEALPGETLSTGQVVIVLADLDTLCVHVLDLDQFDVARVKPGQEVRVLPDALPGRELSGRVISVSLRGIARDDDTVYPLIIKLFDPDPDLRWEMTVIAEIATMP